MQQFHIWFTQVHDSGLAEPNAMVLATVDPLGVPRTRTVLLKAYDRRGLCFFTNRHSPKGRALVQNPQVSVTFPWHAAQRQVIVSGSAKPLSAQENDAYFRSRPYGSQIAAWASEYQSAPVTDRAELNERYERVAQRWPEGSEVPRPPYWGGFRIVWSEVEFWQGGSNRMHDRFRYLLVAGNAADGTWKVDRLFP